MHQFQIKISGDAQTLGMYIYKARDASNKTAGMMLPLVTPQSSERTQLTCAERSTGNALYKPVEFWKAI